MGTSIRIIHRIYVRNIVIRLYHCVIQYDGGLKTVASQDGRYDKKQVVLLVSLNKSYQGFNLEGNQKYGSGDTSESSLVSGRSKDGLAR
jgi:hypothetical protein